MTALFAPSALFIASAPVQVADANGNLSSLLTYPGTSWQYQDMALLRGTFYLYAGNYMAGLLYSDTAGNQFQVIPSRYGIETASALHMEGSAALKTGSAFVTFDLMDTGKKDANGFSIYHATMKAMNPQTKAVLFLVDSDLDNATASIFLQPAGLPAALVQNDLQVSPPPVINAVDVNVAWGDGKGNDVYINQETIDSVDYRWVTLQVGNVTLVDTSGDNILPAAISASGMAISGNYNGQAFSIVVTNSGLLTYTVGKANGTLQLGQPGQVIWSGNDFLRSPIPPNTTTTGTTQTATPAQ